MWHNDIPSELPHMLCSNTPLHDCGVYTGPFCTVVGAAVEVDDCTDDGVDDVHDEDVEITAEQTFCVQSQPAALQFALLVKLEHRSGRAILSNDCGTVPVSSSSGSGDDDEDEDTGEVEVRVDGFVESVLAADLQTSS